MPKSVLITGHTGLVGSQLLNDLLSSSEIEKVFAIGRKPCGTKHPKLSEIITSLDSLNEIKLPSSVDIGYCCLGTTMKKAGSKEAFYKVDFEYVIATAKLAQQHGSISFCVVSAMGADSKSLFYYNRVKGEMEEALKALNFNCLQFFRPSLLLGNRQEKRFGEQLSIKVFNAIGSFMIGSLKKYRASHSDKVAQLMLNKSLEKENGLHIWEAIHFS
tara:strand:- start:1539 stop:2186 length:648 start_codon:yes stop_codon:yes gene_type:complete